MATEQQLIEGIRRADAAGDAQAVRALGQQLLKMRQPAKPKPAPKKEERSFLRDLGSSAVNTVAGIGQGLAAIPDAATNALGAVMAEGVRYGGKGVASVAEAFGADARPIRQKTQQIVRDLYNPITIGGTIEKAAPTPQDMTGKGVRIASQVMGGAANIPGLTTLPARMMATAPAKAPVLQSMTEGQQVAQAAQRQGIKVLPADVGGPTTGRLTALAAQTPFGASPVVKGAREAAESTGSAARRIASSAGRVLDPEDAGEIVRRGAQGYIKKTSSAGGRMYKRAEDLAKGALVNPSQASKALDENIASLAETPETNAAALSILQGLKNDLSKPLSVEAIRSLRTNIRTKIMKEGLRGTDIERRVGQIISAASDDITSSLPKPAASAYRAADTFWRQRVEQIDDILAPVIGKGGDKQAPAIFSAIERMAKGGDSKQLSRLMSSLPEEDAGSITATIIDRLGAAAPGAQDAVGGVFSPSTFLTNWNKLSPKAKAVLFQPELRSALNDLATVTGGMKAASKYANVSQTGGVVGGLATGGVLSGFFSAPVSTTAFVAGQYGLGKLMASPAYVRWLTKGARLAKAKAPDAVMRRHASELRAIASQTPALREEVNRLLVALNDNVGVRAAAGDAEKDQQKQ